MSALNFFEKNADEKPNRSEWSWSSLINNNRMNQRLKSLESAEPPLFDANTDYYQQLPLVSPFFTTSPSVYSPFFPPRTPLDFNDRSQSKSSEEYEINDRAKEAFFFGPNFSASLEALRLESSSALTPGFHEPTSPADVLKSYSKKVFIGGIPIGANYDALHENFAKFGSVKIDWPKKTADSTVPTDGYVFAVFDNEASVFELLKACNQKGNRTVYQIRLPTSRTHQVEVKVWELKNAFYIGNYGWRKYRRFSIFIGGLPRTCSADFLVGSLENVFGNIVYCGIEQDKHTQYPKGAARVVFASKESYIKAIAVHELSIRFPEGERKIELKPFLTANMPCEKCSVVTGTKFCKEMICLSYYCDTCWRSVHSSRPGMLTHEAMNRNWRSK